ncbi:MAG: Abi family protein [Tenuifilaceae bacterium]
MKYEDYEKVLSQARLNRFLNACKSDRQKALQLYRLNIKLSENFFAILCMFEVAFRNAVDQHYINHFKDKEWLKNQCLGKGFLNNPAFSSGRFKSKKKVDSAIRELGIRYTHDRVVSSLSLGFWVNLFAPIQFRLAGQNLHKIFPNRIKGTQPKQIFNDLDSILEFRNRVAHHEPICFNGTEFIDLTSAKVNYSIIIKMIDWMAIDSSKFLTDLDNTTHIISEIESLR